MKRLTRILVAVMLMATMFVSTAFAAASPTVSVTDAEGKKGNAVTVTVNLADNPGFGAYNFTMDYDKTALELTALTSTGLSNSGMFLPNVAEGKTGFMAFADITAESGSLFTATFEIKAQSGSYEVKAIPTSFGGMNGNIANTLKVEAGTITVTADPAAHEHEYGAWTKVDDKKHQQSCECGDVVTANHEFTTVNGNPTCTTGAVTIHTCKDCGYTYNEDIAATGHDFGEYESDGNATCTEDGTKTAVCANCKEEDTVADEGSALGHDMGDWEVTTTAGCGTAGEERRDCSRCEYFETRVVDANDHHFGDYVSDKNATCTEDGTETATCENCGATDTRKVEGSALGHDMGDWEVTTPAGCETAGEERRDCSRCEHFETKEIAATGHDFGEYESDGNATCTEDGTKTAICANCKTEDTVADEGSALGHDMGDWEVTTPAGCETAGEERRDCSRCEHFETKEIAATGHSFTDYVSDENATCTEDGTETAVCDNEGCEKTDTRKVEDSALGHDMGDWEVTKQPTCGAAGEERRDCSRCEHFETKAIPATGRHEFTPVEGKAPTCTEDGNIEHLTCEGCGGFFTVNGNDVKEVAKEDVVIPATGHSFGEWTTVKEPTETEKGLQERVCSVCQHKETKDIPALGTTTPEDPSDKDDESTQTGDDFNMLAAGLIALTAMMVAGGAVLVRRKN